MTRFAIYACAAMMGVAGLVALLASGLVQLQAAPAADNPPARILRVGRGLDYALPSQAAPAARDGDVIEIAAGRYAGDVAVWRANDLTLRGVGGMAWLDAAGKSAEGKAIWVIKGRNTIVSQIGFTGCRVPDRNGAGIRQEGAGLVVIDCIFRENEDGILCGENLQSDIFIEGTEFDANGAGDGLSHNLYIGHIRSLTMTGCYSHRAQIGHAVKSRAETNEIVNNFLADEKDGRSSYLIDLPNGGRSFLIGNVIQHGPLAENGTMVSYAAEGAKNPFQELYVINNTFINARPRGGRCLRVVGEKPLAVVMNNFGTGTQTLLDGPGEASHNLLTDRPGFVDAAAGDYRLAAGSPAIGAGAVPKIVDMRPLLPRFQYRAPCGRMARPASEHPDLGAFAYVP